MKTICIYHSRDLDGWMSAAIVKKWFLNQNIKNIDNYFVFDLSKTNNPYANNTAHTLSMLGWDYGDKIPDLSEYDKVIMCDITFPAEVMYSISHHKDVIWIDHHISSIKDVNKKWLEEDLVALNGTRNPKFAACELTWLFFFTKEKMPEIVRLLGRYDCFGHKGTDEEQKVLEFQYAARALMANYNDCYTYLLHCEIEEISHIGFGIYRYLYAEAKQTYSKAFPINITSIIGQTFGGASHGESIERDYKFLCVNQERFNPINFGIDYHKDGYDGFACFWYKNDQWTFSLYNDNGEVDCSVIAKAMHGGGHKGAAGFVCSDNQMLSLINQ